MICVLDENGRRVPFEYLPVFSLESAVGEVDAAWDDLPQGASTIVIGDGERDRRCYRVAKVEIYRYFNWDWINADWT